MATAKATMPENVIKPSQSPVFIQAAAISIGMKIPKV